MKTNFLLLVSFCFLISSCINRSEPIRYTSYTPILMNKSLLSSSISFQGPSSITKAAKIYYKDGYIFISEEFKGVHIIDNADPKNPINKAFLAIPGCVDMAIKKNVLYVDNAIDLVSIDLTEAENGKLKVLKRVENVFPEVLPPDGGAVPTKFNKENRPENTIVVSWRK